MVILLKSFHIKIASHQKSFTLGPDVHWRLYFYSVASDTRVHARGWDQRSKCSKKITLIFQGFSGVHILTTTDEKDLILGPKVTWRAL